EDGVRQVYEALGRLWLQGAEIDWAAFHAGEHRRRVPLPTYPFERQRYWIEPGIELEKSTPTSRRAAPGTSERLADMAGWLHAPPSWKRVPRPRIAGSGAPGGRRRDRPDRRRSRSAPAPAASAAVLPERGGHPRPASAVPWAAPSTATEEAVAQIWEELLG